MGDWGKMTQSSSKWVYYLDTFLKPIPKEAPYIKLSDVFGQLSSKIQAKETFQLINKETAAISINDVRMDDENQIVHILTQYSDATEADPAFKHLKSNDLRVAAKEPGEGIARSAHIAFSLIHRNNKPSVYLTLLEQATNLGRSKIAPFLTAQCKKFCDFFYEHEDAIKTRRPFFVMSGHASQQLRDDLENGKLLGIELISYKKHSSFDETDYVKPDKWSVHLKVIKEPSGKVALNIINEYLPFAKLQKFDDIRVQFKNEKQRIVPVPLDQEDAGDALYSRVEKIKLSEPIPQCVDLLNNEIVNRMTELILIERRKINLE